MRRPATTAAARGAVTIARVAQRAGVSIATVSRIVNGVENKASAATVARVRRAVDELGYRPISAARSLRENRSRLVALLAANLANPAMAAIAAAAETALREAGLTMILCDTHDRADLQDEYLLQMRAQMARATVLLGAVDSPRLQSMRRDAEPLIFVNRVCPGDTAAAFVGIDNRKAGAEIADHLLDTVGSPLAVVHGALTSSATAARVAGFRERAAARGVALGDGDVVTAAGADHLEIGYAAAAALLDGTAAGEGRPRGVFCSSDLIAFGVHRRAREAGIAVPEEVALVGFDESPLNAWIAPWLSSVEVPYAAFGTAIVAAAHDLMAERQPAPRILPHRLVVRGSTPVAT
ncbi:MAG: LacI family DNA-binding transcriptional regulator [Pseudomonadota bacterium]